MICDVLFPGRPAYNYRVGCQHAVAVAEMAACIVRKPGDELRGIHYVHNSVLPQGRAQWLESAMASGADIGISMDADTWPKDTKRTRGGELLIRLAKGLAGAIHQSWDYAGVLVAQRDGRVNAWAAEGERLRDGDGVEIMRLHEDAPVRAWANVHAVGTAIGLYRLEWFREHVRNPAELYAMIPTGKGLAYVGEDVYQAAVLRGKGAIQYAIQMPTGHGGWFGAQ